MLLNSNATNQTQSIKRRCYCNISAIELTSVVVCVCVPIAIFASKCTDQSRLCMSLAKIDEPLMQVTHMPRRTKLAIRTAFVSHAGQHTAYEQLSNLCTIARTLYRCICEQSMSTINTLFYRICVGHAECVKTILHCDRLMWLLSCVTDIGFCWWYYDNNCSGDLIARAHFILERDEAPIAASVPYHIAIAADDIVRIKTLQCSIYSLFL